MAASKSVEGCPIKFWGYAGNVAKGTPRPGFRISARTVLELGSELISSDIIAFYELVKNAFDAGSKSGVDIKFTIALRRNAYFRIRAKAAAADSTSEGETEITILPWVSLKRRTSAR